MKYYHIVWLSSGLLAIQFILEKIMQQEILLAIRKLFFLSQTILLVTYVAMFLIYRIERRKKIQHRKKQPNRRI